MSTTTTFDSTKDPLPDQLKAIRDGKTQLPDFQRGWVWDDEHIRSLLASVSLSYPIGAVMMLETGGEGIRFKPRLVEGLTLPNEVVPERLILDGQQRLTSLFQALHSGRPVETKDIRGNQIRRWYYVHISKSLNKNGDREDAIVGLPEDRRIRNFRGEVVADYSSPANEYKDGMFPLSQVFDCSEWRRGFNDFWGYDKDKGKQFDAFEKEVIKRFEHYLVPLILLKKDTPKEAVCQVFEKVNTGGVSLTVFELLTATYAADDFNLREDWAARVRCLKKHNVLTSLESTDFLQAVTLLATFEKRRVAICAGTKPDDAPGISCKRKEILRLMLPDYRAWADRVTVGFEKAAKFLYSQKLFAARDLPYRTQLVPLAASITFLRERADNDGVKAKFARWYWCGVLGELYGGAIETRFAKDVPEIIDWVNGGVEPGTVVDANFAAGRLRTLRTRNSAAYKGLYALLIRDGGLDFRSGDSIDIQMYFDEKIDIHHIFPQAWCREKGIDQKLCDCVVNKTALSAKTNRMIGGNAPSVYLARIQKNAGIDTSRMDYIMQSHVIPPASLRSDSFDEFFKVRESALLEKIEKAMGKPIARDATIVQEEFPLVDEQEEDQTEGEGE